MTCFAHARSRSSTEYVDFVYVVRPISMKRSHSDPHGGCSEPKRRTVGYSTFQKWRQELDKECRTVSWLDCETSDAGGKKTATKLKCKVCIKFK